MQEFMTPPGHRGFLAKRLFDENGRIRWGAIAYIEPGGGGPEGNHTHDEAHIFIVTEGEVEVMLDGQAHTVSKNESFFVPGQGVHSIWNRGKETAVVIKISVEEK